NNPWSPGFARQAVLLCGTELKSLARRRNGSSTTQHSGGIVSNQRINPNRLRSLDPRRLVHGPNSDVKSRDFCFLYETLPREPVMQSERRRANISRLIDDSLIR